MGDPGDWERHITLRDGRAVFVRPIRPEDEALYGTFLAAVTSEDARMRFLAPVGQLSHSLIEYFTHIDYARAMAFVAIDEATGELLAVVRLHNNAANKFRRVCHRRPFGLQRPRTWMAAYANDDRLRQRARLADASKARCCTRTRPCSICAGSSDSRSGIDPRERIDLRREACALG